MSGSLYLNSGIIPEPRVTSVVLQTLLESVDSSFHMDYMYR